MSQRTTSEAVAFLEWLRPGGPWLLHRIPQNGGSCKSHWADTTDSAAGFINKWNGRENLYYSLNPTKERMTKKPKKEDHLRAELLLADCDPEDGETREAAKQRYLAAVEKFGVRPSAAIDSGNGIQFLWRLREPLSNPLEAEAHSRVIMRVLGTKAGTENCDRILRLPGTTNLPNKKKREAGRVRCQAQIIWTEDAVYGIDAFPAAPDPERVRGEAEDRMREEWRDAQTKLPPKIEPGSVSIDKLPVSDDVKKVIREGCYDRFGNDRSRAVFHATREMLRAGVHDLIVTHVLLRRDLGISQHVLDQSTPEKYAKRQVERARLGLESFVKDKDGKVIPTVAQNVRVAVAQAGVEVRYDEFSDRYTLMGLDGFGPALDDKAANRLWLLLDEKFKFKPSKEFMTTVICDDAVNRYRFHPVRDYLDALVWDGRPRIDTWLIEYGGAKDTPFVRAVAALILVAAVRRVRRPGCKFDEIPVLESPTQGTDKSTAVNVLAVEDEWFTDFLPLNAEPKVAIEQTRGKWIAEAGELSGMRRADIDKLKAFLSRRTDRARLAYGKLTSEVPRQCIVIGTTNSREYLKDQTGNRRFWPVAIERFDVAALKGDRDQLWAEAAAREARGESIRLDPALWDEAGIEQAERTTSDPFYDALEEHLGQFESARIGANDIWLLLGCPRAAQRTQDMNQRMGEALRRLGWRRPGGTGGNKNKMVRIGGRLTSGYVKGAGERELRVTQEQDGTGRVVFDDVL